MDFKEWFNEVDYSGMNVFYRIISMSSDCDDLDALSALMEKAFEAGYEQGVHMIQVDGPEL
jgi:hypothetical protein